MREIILTHTGKLGDFLYCLPIASWLAEQRECKIHWVLPSTFNPFNYIANLLMAQPFTARVSIVPFQVKNFDCGGQPYRFYPWEFLAQHHKGLDASEYYNLGFRRYPDKYISAFYAEEYCFDYDRDFVLNIGGPVEKTDERLRSTEGAMGRLLPDIAPMGTHEDLLTLVRRLAAAKEVHTWFCGLAILCYMAHVPVIVHRVPGHAYIPFYYEGDMSRVTFIEHEAIP